MFGAVFTREAAVAPRRVSFFAARCLFAAALFALTATAWQVLVGSQRVENIGDLAWFGASAFQILAQFQLAVAMPFSALLVASAVALEKDRKTLDLLLMTNLSNTELVLGKLMASMLTVVMVVVAALPLLAIVSLLGGVSAGQILRVQAVVLASTLVAGSLGSTIALWREKTFQALAMTVLVLVLWLLGWEIIAVGGLGRAWWGLSTTAWAATMSPWQAVLAAAQPQFDAPAQPALLWDPVHVFLGVAVLISALLNATAIAMVRVWNPTRELQLKFGPEREAAAAALPSFAATSTKRVIQVHGAGGKVRPVWDNPILWREIRTWAFGKKILLIRVAYLAVFVACAAAVFATTTGGRGANEASAIPSAALPLVALVVVGLILLNALAVTSVTSERDSRALDLLLVTDLTPNEIVFGKLGGAFYNAKEMIVLPAALCAYLWFVGQLTTENLLFLLGGLAVLSAFAATLGLHAGITYSNSRTAIATSIGTLLFLFLGIATCMKIMLAFSDSFEYQFGAFLGAIAGGSLAMYVALGWRNPSAALGWASGLTPFLTFFIITSFLLGHFGTVFLLTMLTYGFATAAMLVPAIYVFDVATGRTTVQDE